MSVSPTVSLWSVHAPDSLPRRSPHFHSHQQVIATSSPGCSPCPNLLTCTLDCMLEFSTCIFHRCISPNVLQLDASLLPFSQLPDHPAACLPPALYQFPPLADSITDRPHPNFLLLCLPPIWLLSIT